MKNKKKYLKPESSKLLWAIIPTLICLAPCLGMDIEGYVPGILEVDGTEEGGMVNLKPGAIIEIGVDVKPNGVLNIHAGTVGFYGIWLIDPTPELPGNDPVVTVYGTNFADEDGSLGYGDWTPSDGSGTLTGEYENGDPTNPDDDINLLFYSDVPIDLVETAVELLEAELWVLPCFINRERPRPARILTLLRLPEGISKDDIDSGQPLLLDSFGIEAVNQYAFEWYRNGILHTSIIASFNKAELMAAVPDDGEVELQVTGQLNTGQVFYGIQTVTIFSWSW